MSIDQTRSVDQMELPWAVNDGTDRNARNFIQRWGKAVRLNDLTDEWDVVCVCAFGPKSDAVNYSVPSITGKSFHEAPGRRTKLPMGNW